MPALLFPLPTHALGSAPRWAVAGLVALALACALDAALLGLRRDWPLYRRHLTAFGLAATVVAAAAWYAPAHGVALLAIGIAGAALGLALGVLPFLRGRRLRVFSWASGAALRPDPSRDLILVADPHWRSELVGLADATAAHHEADWLFLGEVFDGRVGNAGRATAAPRRLAGCGPAPWWFCKKSCR